MVCVVIFLGITALVFKKEDLDLFPFIYFVSLFDINFKLLD